MPTMIDDDDDDDDGDDDRWDLYHNGDHDVQWDDVNGVVVVVIIWLLIF